MPIPKSATIRNRERRRPAGLLIVRAAFGLARHGLRHPLRPASICRLTGKVTAR